MTSRTPTAQAHPNIALIKYWGNRDDALRLPANGSISLNLDGLSTRTQVRFDPSLAADRLTLNGAPLSGPGLERVAAFLDLVRGKTGIAIYADVVSENNFPAGAGIASSASAFAALALAASKAAGLELDEAQLSRLARRGSGSACRSIPGGFVEWAAGEGDGDSFAQSIAPLEHWSLADCIAMVSTTHKPTGSTEGHALAGTSPLQPARVADTPRRLSLCREAVNRRDFAALAAIVELDSDLMHAVMMTSTPALFYWQPVTLAVMRAVRQWRQEGIPVCYTIDAGPNVHVLCLGSESGRVATMLADIPGVEAVLTASPGGPARLVS
ncbi:MAG: diphosphomevalonate decarboxylase [Chloroflexota bacterium]